MQLLHRVDPPLSLFRKCCFWSRVPSHNFTTRRARTYTTASRLTTPLEKLLSGSIKANGPISVAEYTQLCLSHPTEGYYMKERTDGTDVFGTKGDFITSPEISQVFGELVGIWLLSQWLNSSNGAGHKAKIRLIELGPGRGTLMDDILRTFSNWPHAKGALSAVHLVETSPVMSFRQEEKLANWFHDASHFKLTKCTSIEEIPLGAEDEFTMVIAHEFFDALPAHILEKTSDGFREILVDLNHPDPSGAASIPSPFHFVRCPTSTPRSELLGALSPRFANVPPGTRLEVSIVGWRIARKMGELISRVSTSGGNKKGASGGLNGAGLIIDYGDNHAFDSSFRAFKNHRLVDVFETPGLCDLTTNVDFALLEESFQGIASTHGPLSQSDFLLRMGIRERLAVLVRRAPSDGRRHGINRAGGRLIDRAGQGMGAVYRVLGITGLQAQVASKNLVWPFIDGSQS